MCAQAAVDFLGGVTPEEFEADESVRNRVLQRLQAAIHGNMSLDACVFCYAPPIGSYIGKQASTRLSLFNTCLESQVVALV